MTVLIILVGCWLAYSNGANDNFKGVATLYGSGTTSFRRAQLWAALTTLLGSLLAVFVASKLVTVFSGKGLVPPELAGTPPLLISVAAGSAITILLATRLGLPTSTTHALTGGLVGVALLAARGIEWQLLLNNFVQPLLVSPFIAIALAIILNSLIKQIAGAGNINNTNGNDACLCVESDEARCLATANNNLFSLTVAPALPILRLDQLENCQPSRFQQLWRFNRAKTFDI